METIKGLDGVKKKLDELPKKAERTIIKKGMRAGAKLWKDAAKAEAPKLTGLMASLIKVRSGGASNGTTRITVGVDAKDFTGEAFYASFVLYGHKVGKRSLGNDRKDVAPNNFLERAFETVKDAVVQTTQDKWWELIEDAVKE